MQIPVEYIKWLTEERDKINRVPFDELEFFENGMKMEIKPEVAEEWRFVGLNNIDFITTGYYNAPNVSSFEEKEEPYVDPFDADIYWQD